MEWVACEGSRLALIFDFKDVCIIRIGAIFEENEALQDVGGG